MTEREALKLALELIQDYVDEYGPHDKDSGAQYVVTAIKEALAQPEHGWTSERIAGMSRLKEAQDKKLAQPESCEYCNGTGDVHSFDGEWRGVCVCKAGKALAQPEQEPVAMKFKIYKPTVPDPTRQGINNALLPWVYDQDRASGFDATMWVTPVATLPPQRKPLTDEQRDAIARQAAENDWHDYEVIDAVEAAHGIKGKA